MSIDSKDPKDVILREMKDKKQPALAIWSHGMIQISLDDLCLQ